MFSIDNVTHNGQPSEAFENAKRVGELSRKLQTHLSWHFGSVQVIIDESKNKITIRISDKDRTLFALKEAENMIKELRELINKIEEQA